MDMTVQVERGALIRRIFPDGMARLWCPPLTHYRQDGSLDTGRIEAHIGALAPYVGGLLVPGSTGDGWDLTRVQKMELLDTVLPVASRLGLPVLIGVLERTTDAMLDFVRSLEARTSAAPVVGIVACAPCGADQSEASIEASLDRILTIGLPTAIYQLPQVTGNEISVDTIERLAAQFSNFFMVKDSSGDDHIALSHVDLGGVFLVRGAELGYSGWLRPRGPYDGFLLSTANWLAPQLATIVAGKGTVRLDAAVDSAVAGAFDLVPGYPTGNAFGNSATLMDHALAFGGKAATVPGPFSRDGKAFPKELVEQAVRLLQKNGLLPATGYMQA